jgi:hypothetical protein
VSGYSGSFKASSTDGAMRTRPAGDATYGQFTLSPFQTRVLFQARAFF